MPPDNATKDESRCVVSLAGDFLDEIFIATLLPSRYVIYGSLRHFSLKYDITGL